MATKKKSIDNPVDDPNPNPDFVDEYLDVAGVEETNVPDNVPIDGCPITNPTAIQTDIKAKATFDQKTTNTVENVGEIIIGNVEDDVVDTVKAEEARIVTALKAADKKAKEVINNLGFNKFYMM